MKRLLPILVIVFALSAAAQESNPISHINSLFEKWRFEEAARVADQLYKSAPQDPVAKTLRAEALFYLGEYAQAKQIFDSLEGFLKSYPQKAEIAHYNQKAYEVTKNMVRHTSPDGHFILLTEKGRSEILALYAFDALRAAYENIGSDVGFFPEIPVRVEVYGSARDLAAVSPLSEENIKTSGTIALSKYNRLMITSPEALIFGYQWLDTLSHEFVHLILGKATENRLPLWLHEGLARLLESRWRGEYRKLGYMDDGLLRWALERPSERLVTFKEMHPSFAMLPSQDKAALAYSQVYYSMRFLKELEGGVKNIERLVALIREGENDLKSVEKVSRLNFESFQAAWQAKARREITALPLKPDEYPTLYSFLGMGTPTSAEDEAGKLEDIKNKNALKYVRLAEIMRSRGHIKPAIAEYRKAYRYLTRPDPIVMNRFARTLLREKMYEEAKPIIEQIEKLYPEDLSSRINLARYYYGVNDVPKAIEYYEKANQVNPFNPEIHAALLKLYEKKGDAEKKKREELALKILKGSRSPEG